MSRFLIITVVVLVGLLALFLSAMNSSQVEIELAFARLRSPLGVALIVAFTLGLLGGLFWQAKWIAQLLNERGRLRRALRLAESKARRESEAA
ncbi:MAG TPA: lipopolysaccharide assembly protein LapA domain-containing protein [Steroidobacteraceae bacterium]